MRLFSVHKNERGFTLIELLIILLFIAALSVISVPSFLGMLNKFKLNDAFVKARGALQEVQTEAIRRSRECKVALTSGNRPSLASNCFVIVDYIVKVSVPAVAGATTVTVAPLPVAISSGTGLVFSNGATGVVSASAAKGGTSLTLSGGISKAIAGGEIVAFRTLPDGVAMATNIESTGVNPPAITFSFKGNTTVALPGGADSATTVLYLPVGSGQKKCLAISSGIGIVRTGNYSGSTSSAADVTAGTCTTSL